MLSGPGGNRTGIPEPEDFRLAVFPLLLATLSINIFSLALPVMTKQVYNRILPNPDTGTLSVLISGVCVAVILEAILRLCRAYVIGRSGAAYEHRMACMAMDRILNADLSRMEACGVGEHLHRMGAVSRLKDFHNGYSLTVVLELAFVPLFLALIVYIAGVLALVPAVLILAFTALSLWNGYRLRHALQAREKADDLRFNFLIEALEGVHTLKAFALERFFERKYEALEEDSTRANYRVTQETSGAFNTGATFSHLMVAGVVTCGAWLVLNGMLTTGALIATLLLSGRMMQPVQKALALWTRYQDYLLAKRHIERLLNMPQHAFGDGAEAPKDEPEGRLSFSGVSFAHRGGDRQVLDHVDLSLAPGECILLTGAHGAGKTALLDLAAGIYPPASGEILLDGRAIMSYSPEDLPRHIGFIRTKPLIFRGTIRDNLTCFGMTDEDKAREVSALLNVDKDVAKLPAGFDTFLSGTVADSISHGLRQRIAMARALALKPRLILFDNADRALDKEGYALIYSLLARLKGRATMILVTDDLNISALADRRYELKDGRLASADDTQGRTTNIRPYRELPL